MDDERNAFRTAGAFSGNYVYLEHGASATSGNWRDCRRWFFREGGSMSYGLYLNSDVRGNVSITLVPAGATTIDPARLDLFLKGNSGMNWGVRLGRVTQDLLMKIMMVLVLTSLLTLSLVEQTFG